MKTSVKNIFFAIGTTAILASCSENSWNDHLEGFESGVNYNNAIEAAYTMTAADYSAVASNSTNKELAESAGLSNELKAVGTNAMFSSEIPARQYLPAYLASSSAPYFVAPEGSKINITYEETGETDPIIAQIAGATSYTVSKNDYIRAWGSEVDYISAFAPMTSAENKLPGILKTAIPEAEAGAYAIVSYNESESNPVFIADSETSSFAGGLYYMVADGTTAATPLAATYNYGYLQPSSANVSNGTATTSELNALMFIPTDGGYYILDAYGRYVYQSGTYNSFNVSKTIPETGGVWTVEVASNGQATITNTAVNKWIQLDSSYGTWGSYNSEKGSLPVLYSASNVKFYMVTSEGNGAGPLASKTYGYLTSVDMTVENGIVTNADSSNAFTFENADGGFYIKDSSDRYVYQKDGYNSFNFSAELPETGAVWTISADANGLIVKNVEFDKWIQYDSTYASWGSYPDSRGTLPMLYNAVAAVASANKPSRVVAGTPATTGKNAVYYFDGSAWSVAEGVCILNPADYTAMGYSNNSLEDPDVYLPIYMKTNKPYAVAGDSEAVVYNGNACAVLVYDGQNWTVNDNGQQTVTAQFMKNSDGWSFVKFVGKTIFDLTTELILDRQYLIVAEAICANPVKASYSYGYLYTTDVKINKGSIVLENEVNAFTFATTAVVDDKEYTLPDGQFFIVDSNDRYYYMTGSYTSFNVKDAPVVTDGAVSNEFVWTAEHNGSGVWTIKNFGNGNYIQYSPSYSSFGCYAVEQSNAVMPSLYVIEVAE